MNRFDLKTVAQNGKAQAKSKQTLHHEGREEHEVKKFKNINFPILRVLRALRGDTVFFIDSALYFPLRSSSRRFWIGVKSIQSGRLIQRYSLSFLLFASGGKSSCGKSSLSDPTLSSSVLAWRNAICPSSDRNQLMNTLARLG